MVALLGAAKDCIPHVHVPLHPCCCERKRGVGWGGAEGGNPLQTDRQTEQIGANDSCCRLLKGQCE